MGITSARGFRWRPYCRGSTGRFRSECCIQGWVMGQKRIHLVVRGRVQDVFFRASAQREARRLGLTGWVRNRQDGAVELIAEGEEDQVKDLLAWAQHGPST